MITENKTQSPARLTIILHWLIATLVFMLFFSGIWMVELGYYDPWYYRAPSWHKSVGVIMLVLLLVRWFWQLFHVRTVSSSIVGHWQRRLSCLVHALMTGLILGISISGYFIVTAKGQSLAVFDWFQIPAMLQGIANLEDWAGKVHYYLAYVLMGFVVLHVLAALKHHFIDKDDVLIKMLGRDK